jgi:hypothetical protein
VAACEDIDVHLTTTRPAGFKINTASSSPNWFTRHWRGEISLGEAYWLNGFVVANFLPALLLFGYEAAQPFSHSLRTGAAAAVILRLAEMAIWIWAVLGIIRSADRHVSHGGSRFWANAARVTVCISVLTTAKDLYNSVIPITRLMAAIAVGRDPMEKASVESIANGTTKFVGSRPGSFRKEALRP